MVNRRVQIGIHKSLPDKCSVLWIVAVCNQFLGVDVAVVCTRDINLDHDFGGEVEL